MIQLIYVFSVCNRRYRKFREFLPRNALWVEMGASFLKQTLFAGEVARLARLLMLQLK